MTQEIAKRSGGVAPYESQHLPALRAEEVRARVNLIQQVMHGVMKNGVHYGAPPGMPKDSKPMLLKALRRRKLLSWRRVES